MAGQAAKPKPQSKKESKSPLPSKTMAMVAMRNAGMTYEDIGKQVHLSTTGVWKHLKRITPDMQEYHDLKLNLPDQFAKACLDNMNISAKLNNALLNIPDEDLMKMNPVNVAAIKRTADVGFGIAHDHYRTESGQSNTNVAIIIDRIMAEKALDP